MNLTRISLILIFITYLSLSKKISLRPKLTFSNQWKYLTKMQLNKQGSFDYVIKNSALSTPEKFDARNPPIALLQILIYTKSQYFKAKQVNDCQTRRKMSMTMRAQQIQRVVPIRIEPKPQNPPYFVQVEQVRSPRSSLYTDSKEPLYFVLSVCSSNQKIQEVKASTGFELNRTTFRQLFNNISIELNIVDAPNSKPSLQYKNMDRNYLILFLISVGFTIWALLRIKQYYRKYKSFQTPLCLFVIVVCFDLVANLFMYFHFDVMNSNGQGVPFLLVFSCISFELQHMLMMALFGLLALGWVISSQNFPDEEMEIIIGVCILIVSIVASALNIITIDSDWNFMVNGWVQMLFISLCCFAFIAQYIIEFSNLAKSCPMNKKIMASRTRFVAILYASGYPLASFITKFFVQLSHQQFVWVLIMGWIQIIGFSYVMLTIGNPQYWKTCAFDDSTYLPSTRKNKVKQYMD